MIASAIVTGWNIGLVVVQLGFPPPSARLFLKELLLHVSQLFLRRRGGPPRRTEPVVAVPRNQVDVVVKDLLPGRRAVGLRDIQAQRIEFVAQQARDSVNRLHDGAGFVFRECPDVFGMSPRDDKRVATGDLAFVQERDAVLVFVHEPGRQHASKDFAERAIHRAMIPGLFLDIPRSGGIRKSVVRRFCALSGAGRSAGRDEPIGEVIVRSRRRHATLNRDEYRSVSVQVFQRELPQAPRLLF